MVDTTMVITLKTTIVPPGTIVVSGQIVGWRKPPSVGSCVHSARSACIKSTSGTKKWGADSCWTADETWDELTWENATVFHYCVSLPSVKVSDHVRTILTNGRTVPVSTFSMSQWGCQNQKCIYSYVNIHESACRRMVRKAPDIRAIPGEIVHA